MFKQTQSSIAAMTELTANNTRLVVVVNMEFVPSIATLSCPTNLAEVLKCVQ